MNQSSKLRPKQVMETVASEQQKGDLPVLPLQFMPANDFTTFRGEVAVDQGDFVYHFFVTAEVQAMPQGEKYWKEVFPTTLERAAKAYFHVDFPRLQATYVEELASWWFRAYGFGRVLGPQKMALRFFDDLDAALEAAIVSS
jgi:hypothetical protein